MSVWLFLTCILCFASFAKIRGCDSDRGEVGWNHVLDFGVHKGKYLKDVPKSYIQWIVKKNVYQEKPNLDRSLRKLDLIKGPFNCNSEPPEFPLESVCASIKDITSIPKFYVYVLQLKQSKWYVGVTENMERRYSEHIDGKGSGWTRKHSVMRIHETFVVKEEEKVGAESKKVAELMWLHGVNRVRGAEHCNSWPFDTRDTDRLVHYLGHHLEINYEVVKRRIEPQLQETNPGSKRPSRSIRSRAGSTNRRRDEPGSNDCFRCGRGTHWESDCFANFHVDGSPLDDSVDSTDAERPFAAWCSNGGSKRAPRRADGRRLRVARQRECGRSVHQTAALTLPLAARPPNPPRPARCLLLCCRRRQQGGGGVRLLPVRPHHPLGLRLRRPARRARPAHTRLGLTARVLPVGSRPSGPGPAGTYVG
jgi:predicted GIY-YIG superfamily endonuclease